MKIGYVVGRLARGGAELQLMQLTAMMARRGHDVEVFAYDGASPLDDELRDKGVSVRTASGGGKWTKRRVVRSWFDSFEPDVVHGIMKRASSLAAVARAPSRKPPVVASDMSTATYGRHKAVFWLSMLVFGLADRVVTQTELNRRNLTRSAPWLRDKTVVIRNGLDVERFSPSRRGSGPHDTIFRFCVVGTVYAVKNPKGVIRAAASLREQGSREFVVDWYGRLALGGDDAPSGTNEAIELAREMGVDDIVRFHGETDDVARAYVSADALLHASVQEGFPNAVAEGMACGLPIVVSDVSDLPQVVGTARNGYLFSAHDPDAMSYAMKRMIETPDDERRAMGERSRDLAERWFALDRFADEVETLYRRLLDEVR